MAATAITSLVPAVNIRVGFVGQGVALPYISHGWVANEEVRTHEGRARLQFWPIYQISVFADTEKETDAIAAAVMSTFQDYRSGGIQVTKAVYGPHLYEDPEGIHQQVIELSIAEFA